MSIPTSMPCIADASSTSSAFVISNRSIETEQERDHSLVQRIRELADNARSAHDERNEWVNTDDRKKDQDAPAESSTRTIRSLFVSDLHLGSRFCKAGEVLSFLRSHRPEHLYLVGDIIDAWALRRRWHWPKVYDELLDHVAKLVESGTKVFYTPGNHDSFLRKFPFAATGVTLQDQVVHECADGRRLIVMHGDQFDKVEGGWQWLSVVGSVAYDMLLVSDRSINTCLKRLGLRPKRISATAKKSVKLAVQFISKFETKLAEHALAHDCDGIVCGHIHVPRYRMLGEVLYVNLGDWIENSSALVEHHDGKLELVEQTPTRAVRQPSSKRRKLRAQVRFPFFFRSVMGNADRVA